MKRLRQAIKEGVKYDNQIMKSIVERLKDTNDDKTKPNNDKPIQTDKEPINVKVKDNKNVKNPLFYRKWTLLLNKQIMKVKELKKYFDEVIEYEYMDIDLYI